MENAYEKLEKLDAEKRKRILYAALKEFADNGYAKASTNQIVKAAGIGKGMLFYYFNSKKGLYIYLIDYALDIVMNEFLLRIEEEVPDLIDHLRHISQLKWEYFKSYPEVNQFLGTVMLNERDQLPNEIWEKYQNVLKMGHTKVYRNKEKSQNIFREDINPQKAYQLIEWAVKGYQEENLARFTGLKMSELDLPKMWKEFDDYLEILRTVFYKESNLN